MSNEVSDSSSVSSSSSSSSYHSSNSSDPCIRDGVNECPICNDIYTGKVFQCREGHVICDKCMSLMNVPRKCPTCRLPMDPPIRNRVLEDLGGLTDEEKLEAFEARRDARQAMVCKLMKQSGKLTRKLADLDSRIQFAKNELHLVETRIGSDVRTVTTCKRDRMPLINTYDCVLDRDDADYDKREAEFWMNTPPEWISVNMWLKENDIQCSEDDVSILNWKSYDAFRVLDTVGAVHLAPERFPSGRVFSTFRIPRSCSFVISQVYRDTRGQMLSQTKIDRYFDRV